MIRRIRLGCLAIPSFLPVANPVLRQPCCFLLHRLSSLDSVFGSSLLALRSLSIFVDLTTLQDSLHDLPRVHSLEIVIANLVIYTQRFGTSVRIVRKGNKRCGAVVDCIRNAVRDIIEEGFARCEWDREYNGVNVLPTSVSET